MPRISMSTEACGSRTTCSGQIPKWERCGAGRLGQAGVRFFSNAAPRITVHSRETPGSGLSILHTRFCWRRPLVTSVYVLTHSSLLNCLPKSTVSSRSWHQMVVPAPDAWSGTWRAHPLLTATIIMSENAIVSSSVAAT